MESEDEDVHTRRIMISVLPNPRTLVVECLRGIYQVPAVLSVTFCTDSIFGASPRGEQYSGILRCAARDLK